MPWVVVVSGLALFTVLNVLVSASPWLVVIRIWLHLGLFEDILLLIVLLNFGTRLAVDATLRLALAREPALA